MELGQTVKLRDSPFRLYLVASRKITSRILDINTDWSGIISNIPSKLPNVVTDSIDIVLQDGDEVAIKAEWIQV